MAEPDEVMPGPNWPSDWNTGWISFIYSDLLGMPIEGTLSIQLSVERAVSPGQKTTVWGGRRDIQLFNGRPSGDFVVYNSQGVPCVEMPRGDDSDIMPTNIYLYCRESWSETIVVRKVTAEHTLESPLFISAELRNTEQSSAVLQRPVILIDSFPPDADDLLGVELVVGDLFLAKDTLKGYRVDAL